MKTKNTHGGKRKRAGRKPLDDKRIPVRIFPQESRVKTLGGEEATKKFCLESIEGEYTKIIVLSSKKKKSKNV